MKKKIAKKRRKSAIKSSTDSDAIVGFDDYGRFQLISYKDPANGTLKIMAGTQDARKIYDVSKLISIYESWEEIQRVELEDGVSARVHKAELNIDKVGRKLAEQEGIIDRILTDINNMQPRFGWKNT